MKTNNEKEEKKKKIRREIVNIYEAFQYAIISSEIKKNFSYTFTASV